ncbi:hypothetical protein KK062_06305 [Fulvivirgaceae bacterium PWU5]|uniref:Uncharacterized protein n=1 Tax=Dawidia cretensis TaxID=2782350 RepID=A0AAP2DXH8_9BACT|nr:hypothetical protein [Dawidia cretensis]MBT1707822.1 hypothetical protein [Dawidia cretensis]
MIAGNSFKLAAARIYLHIWNDRGRVTEFLKSVTRIGSEALDELDTSLAGIEESSTQVQPGNLVITLGNNISINRDYRDYKIDYLERLFQKRNVHYKRFVKEGPLFDFYEPVTTSDKSFSIENQVQIPIEHLEFKFGIVAFKYQSEQFKMILIGSIVR